MPGRETHPEGVNLGELPDKHPLLLIIYVLVDVIVDGAVDHGGIVAALISAVRL